MRWRSRFIIFGFQSLNMKTLICLTLFLVFHVIPAVGQTDTNQVVYEIDVLPEPVGGWSGFWQFLRKEIKYPKADLEAGIEGKIIVQFVVDTDGTLSDIQLSPGTETAGTVAMREESLRVIGLSPKWKPGMLKGEPVPTRYQVPFEFKLNHENGKKKKQEMEKTDR